MDYKNYRMNEIQTKLNKMGIRPLDVMITGVTGAGKSTTLNSVFKADIAKVGKGTDPETMCISDYMLNDCVRLWDTPGLGDGINKDISHSKNIINLLLKTYEVDQKPYGFIDLVLVIIDGSTRDMGTTYKLLNEVIVPNFPKDRILIAINQADMAMKGRHWIKTNSKPDNVLKNFLDEKVDSIQKRVLEATGVSIKKPIYYSAEYDYNIDKFFDFIVNNIPTEKRDLYIG